MADHNDPNAVNSIFSDIDVSAADLYDFFGFPSGDTDGGEKVVMALTFASVPSAGVFDTDMLYRMQISGDPRVAGPGDDENTLKGLLRYFESLKEKFLGPTKAASCFRICGLMIEWPALVLMAFPPSRSTSSGKAFEQTALYSMVAPGSFSSTFFAMRAAARSPEMVVPFSSIMKQRSASPSKATPKSAPSATTRSWSSLTFSGSIGFGGWLGKVPSSSKYIGTYSKGRCSKIGGTILPAMPFPASITIFSRLRPSVWIKLRQCFA